MADKQVWVRYLDENGNEIERKPKGRGRAPSEVDADGNYIVRVKGKAAAKRQGQKKAEQTQEVQESATTETAEADEAAAPTLPTKRVQAKSKTTPEAIVGACLAWHRIEQGHLITLRNVDVVTKTSGLEEIPFNSNMHQIVIDSQAKEVSIWYLRMPNQPPEIVLANALE